MVNRLTCHSGCPCPTWVRPNRIIFQVCCCVALLCGEVNKCLCTPHGHRWWTKGVILLKVGAQWILRWAQPRGCLQEHEWCKGHCITGKLHPCGWWLKKIDCVTAFLHHQSSYEPSGRSIQQPLLPSSSSLVTEKGPDESCNFLSYLTKSCKLRQWSAQYQPPSAL